MDYRVERKRLTYRQRLYSDKQTIKQGRSTVHSVLTLSKWVSYTTSALLTRTDTPTAKHTRITRACVITWTVRRVKDYIIQPHWPLTFQCHPKCYVWEWTRLYWLSKWDPTKSYDKVTWNWKGQNPDLINVNTVVLTFIVSLFYNRFWWDKKLGSDTWWTQRSLGTGAPALSNHLYRLQTTEPFYNG